MSYIKSEHSPILRSRFPISPVGVDWYNPHNIAFEFKETHAKNEDRVIFKVPLRQLEYSDYIVFFSFVDDVEIYIYKSKYIKDRHSFNNKRRKANIRLNRIRSLQWLMEFNDLDDLKDYLNQITK